MTDSPELLELRNRLDLLSKLVESQCNLLIELLPKADFGTCSAILAMETMAEQMKFISRMTRANAHASGRDPMEFQPVLQALQSGCISTGKARELFCEWLSTGEFSKYWVPEADPVWIVWDRESKSVVRLCEENEGNAVVVMQEW